MAANLAGLGCRTFLAGPVGYDVAGDKVRSLLGSMNIEDRCFETKAFPTITKTRIVCANQQLMRIDEEVIDVIGEKEQAILFQTLDRLLEQVNVLVLSDYGKECLAEALAGNA